MTYDIKVLATCHECGDKTDLEDECFKCEECIEKNKKESFKEALEYLINEDSLKSWEDPEFFIGFNSEEEKKSWLDGMKHGYEHALFWLADYYEETGLFEKLSSRYTKKRKSNNVT